MCIRDRNSRVKVQVIFHEEIDEHNLGMLRLVSGKFGFSDLHAGDSGRIIVLTPMEFLGLTRVKDKLWEFLNEQLRDPQSQIAQIDFIQTFSLEKEQEMRNE